MATQQAREIMTDYFNALGTGDLARYFADDVTWTTMETGAELRGPPAVQDAIIGLHARMSESQTRQLVLSDACAYIEGTWLPPRSRPESWSW